MTNNGECELCGERGELYLDTAIVFGRVFDDCELCAICAGIDDLQLTPSNDVETFDETIESHLSRYIVNRDKRTKQTWHVTRRFQTSCGYDRVYIKNESNTRVRIWYDVFSDCWKRS